MTALAYRPAAPTASPATSVLGEARLLAGLDHVERVDHAHHLFLHGVAPVLDRARLQQWCGDVRLLGRGGAAFPVHRKLAGLPTNGSIAVVANGSESEPASWKDRALMRRAPHIVLDGLRVVAGALAARTVLISVHDQASAESLRHAVAERADLPAIRIDLVSGGFVAGEARALIAGAAGAAAVPPGRRVHAVERGLDGRPTFLANVETFAQIAVLARTGPAGFARTGSAVEPGTRLFTVGGATSRAGVIEAPGGVPLDFLVGSPGVDVLLGGYHGNWTSASSLALSAPDVAAAGLSLGAGVVIALDGSTCPLGEVARVAHWLAGESAGQCGPCFFGLPALAGDLAAIVRGDVTAHAAAARHLDVLPGRGACAHPDGAVRFVKSALVHFRIDVAAHLAGGCGRPVRGVLPLPQGDPR